MFIQNIFKRGFPTPNVIAKGQVRFLKRPALNQTQLKEGKRTGALAMKVGMLSVFDKWGIRHPATVLCLDECQVLQQKRMETDGYTALQLGVGEAKARRVNIVTAGQYKLSGAKPKRNVQEFLVSPDALLEPGTKISALHFVPGQLVDVCGISKGKGFQGVMKRHNFKGGRATHGTSLAHRVPGSTGMRQDPGKVFKNKKMPGRMGGERKTTQNLFVLKVDAARDLVYVRGAVPGNAGVFVRIVDAVKGPFAPSPLPIPTFTGDTKGEAVFAPMSLTDSGIFTAPDDPY